jgi:tRNA A-37 threonylcarbamoyl transferase component Bud32
MPAAIELTDFTPARFTDSRLYTAEINGRKWLVKVYANEQQGLRRELERRKLLHWRERGFSVPEVLDIELDLPQPYLAMEYIDGMGLSDYLKDDAVGWMDKKNTLGDIFRNNWLRHARALRDHDALLLHTDPNTDNILLTRQGFCFIDFEHPGSIDDLETAIASEVATFARRALSDVGRQHTEETIALLLQAYCHDERIFNRIESLTLGRLFQWLHRLKDRQKKRKHPHLATRYDVADGVHSLRRR